MKKLFVFLLGMILCFIVAACQDKHPCLKVAATSVPHAEMLELIKEDLRASNIDLKIITIDDYNLPNRLLAEKEIDANFFQHIPFLEAQNKEFGFDLIALEKIHIEPLGIYSKKINDLQMLGPKAVIAIPNDPTNEARALILLKDLGFIELKSGVGFAATPLDITHNPHGLIFKEMDAPFLARTLDDVDMALIPANFALNASLSPKQALALEQVEQSPYANVVAIRKGEEKEQRLIILKNCLKSKKVKNFLSEKYKDNILFE